MIKKFDGYDDIEIFEGGKALEVGGYILKIMNAKVEEYATCSILKVAFDIAEGEFKDHFKERFERDKKQNANAKWKGVFDVFIPKDDGSELDGYTKQAFKRFITSVEKSNNGFKWDWDETKLKGKLFGGIFGREEFKTDKGEYKFAVKCRWCNSVETIKNGDFKIPDDKLIKRCDNNSTSDMDLSGYETILADGDVPF
jgi:hypothetical protein